MTILLLKSQKVHSYHKGTKTNGTREQIKLESPEVPPQIRTLIAGFV